VTCAHCGIALKPCHLCTALATRDREVGHGLLGDSADNGSHWCNPSFHTQAHEEAAP
jgi:hypothetical protein